ncbi:MAG: glutathione binding-like protein, partial [Novosphingobium sp.]
AACWYLAEGSALVPADRFDRADMLHWLFFEQYNHEPNVATLRFWLHYLGRDKLSEVQRGQLAAKQTAGDAALRLMDDHLATRAFFVGDSVTLADIALFAYTHVAEEGGAFALSDYPAVQAWIARVEGLDRFVAMSD